MWGGMDTGDTEGVIATFIRDGAVIEVTGKRWDTPQVTPWTLPRGP